MRKVLFIFSELSDSDVEWLGQAGDRIHLDPGTVLIPLRSRVDSLYFVLEGEVVVRTADSRVLARMGSGEVLGEMSLVDPAPTAVSVEAGTDALLLRIPNERVRQKLKSDPAFAARFYRALCVFMADRIRQTTARMGYGDAALDPDAKDELNESLLDNVTLAGARFDRMLKRLAG